MNSVRLDLGYLCLQQTLEMVSGTSFPPPPFSPPKKVPDTILPDTILPWPWTTSPDARVAELNAALRQPAAPLITALRRADLALRQPAYPDLLFVPVAQVVILQPARGIELERKIPADVAGSNRFAARQQGRMEVHNARLKFTSAWQLGGVGRAEDRIYDGHGTTICDHTSINGVEAYGSALGVCTCRPIRLA